LKRIIKVLVATALMVVLMASTAVSPALANHNKDGYHFGYGPDKTSTSAGYQYKGNVHVYGWACGSKKQEGYNDRYC
jgi:hypothetical protein